jgi:alkylhydroperoxidase/carboxymuconolactone decarboxylase family protein YurZ
MPTEAGVSRWIAVLAASFIAFALKFSGYNATGRGQLRIALNSGVTKEEIVELFIHLEAYAGAARAFDSYQVALAVFAEST